VNSQTLQYAVYTSSAVWGVGDSEASAAADADQYLRDGGNTYAQLKLKGELAIAPVSPHTAKLINERGGEGITLTLNANGIAEIDA